jgi:hypothetical protein
LRGSQWFLVKIQRSKEALEDLFSATVIGYDALRDKIIMILQQSYCFSVSGRARAENITGHAGFV